MRRLLPLIAVNLALVSCSGRQPVSWSDGASAGAADGPSLRALDAGIPRPPVKPDGSAVSCDPAKNYQPTVTLALQGDKAVARISNPGCKTLYRLQGCCNEGAPLVEIPTYGSWIATCDNKPEECCAALPTCEPFLPPGKTVEEPVDILDNVNCCGTYFRVTYFFSRSPGCIDDALYPVPMARSAEVKLRDEDPCLGSAP